MNRIDRYLIRHIFAMTGLVGLVLVSIYTFVVFVSEIGRVGDGGFGVLQLVEYTVLLIPTNAYILLPLIALLGALLGLGHIAQQNELVAIRSAGVSWMRMGGAALIAGIVLGIGGLLLGSWIGPAGQLAAESIRHPGHRDAGGQWLRDANNIVHIQDLKDAHEIAGITIFHLAPDHDGITSMVAAASARYADGHWQLTDVKRSDFGPDGVSAAHSAKSVWNGGVTPSVLKLFVLEQNSLTIPGLTRLVEYLHGNHLDASKYEMLLWRKLVEPFSIIAMVLLAVPFAGAGRLREAGMGQRLLAGIGIGIVFYVSDKVAVSLGNVYGWSAPLSAATPTLLFLLVAWWRLGRVR